MPDICLCQDENCPNKNNCYRFTAIPNMFRQTYFTGTPLKKDEKKCEYFMPNQQYKANLLKQTVITNEDI